MRVPDAKAEEDAELARTAEALVSALREIERISGRSQSLELEGWNQIVRAGELLGKAADAHQRFVKHLTSLTSQVEALRDRHNVAAEGLSQAATRIDAARQAYEGLQERFAALGQAALDIDALLKSAAPGSEGDDGAMRAALAGVRDRLQATLDDARVLSEDARQAGLTDLEKRADGIRQQLDTMLATVTRVVGPDA